MRTDQKIVDETNQMARIIYFNRGYVLPKGFKFYEHAVSRHPHEVEAWNAARDIQLMLTNTDANDAVDNLEE